MDVQPGSIASPVILPPLPLCDEGVGCVFWSLQVAGGIDYLPPNQQTQPEEEAQGGAPHSPGNTPDPPCPLQVIA